MWSKPKCSCHCIQPSMLSSSMGGLSFPWLISIWAALCQLQWRGRQVRLQTDIGSPHESEKGGTLSRSLLTSACLWPAAWNKGSAVWSAPRPASQERGLFLFLGAAILTNVLGLPGWLEACKLDTESARATAVGTQPTTTTTCQQGRCCRVHLGAPARLGDVRAGRARRRKSSSV